MDEKQDNTEPSKELDKQEQEKDDLSKRLSDFLTDEDEDSEPLSHDDISSIFK